MSTGKHRTIWLVIGDIFILWVGLFATLILRYEDKNIDEAFWLHVLPFTIVFALWILVFYIAGLYEVRSTSDIPQTLKLLLYAMATAGVLAISLFYFVPFFIITPRLNLIVDLCITVVLLIAWRTFFIRRMRISLKTKLLVCGSSPDIEELMEAITMYPQLGYEVRARIDTTHDIIPYLRGQDIDIVIAPKKAQSNENLVQALYETLPDGIRFTDAAEFYEHLMGKVPVSLISKMWFLENFTETEKRFFESIKRGIDILFTLPLGIMTIGLFPFIATLIKLDSRGPIFLAQQRVGKMGKPYTHYKYRTMIALGPGGHAEPNGAQWAKKDDVRITRVGKFLRATRIDELPQLWNILKGDLSFIGPRPERPEFVEQLREKIPFYDMRHLVRPGLSGWAQTNPPYYYGTEKEAMLKLQYDLFYIKNRDLGLDLDIALKTLMVILTARGR